MFGKIGKNYFKIAKNKAHKKQLNAVFHNIVYMCGDLYVLGTLIESLPLEFLEARMLISDKFAFRTLERPHNEIEYKDFTPVPIANVTNG